LLNVRFPSDRDRTADIAISLKRATSGSGLFIKPPRPFLASMLAEEHENSLILSVRVLLPA